MEEVFDSCWEAIGKLFPCVLESRELRLALAGYRGTALATS